MVTESLLVPETTLARCVESHLPTVLATPKRVFFETIARSNFAAMAGRCGNLLLPAYSVKTNPRHEMLRSALEYNLLAEVISGDEYALARSIGFESERIIYNGPRPLENDIALIAFADSLEALESYCASGRSMVAGIRYRPAGIESRFGIARARLQQCAEIIRRCAASSVALHFHVRPQDYGERSWVEIANEALSAAAELQSLSAKPLTYLDVGGGLNPDALGRALESTYPCFAQKAVDELHELQHILIEPGQGIATPVEAVITRVVEVRRNRGSAEAIVDTGYPDLPQARTSAHRVFHARDGNVAKLPAGHDRVSGSTCLEYDVLAESVRIDGVVERGDLLAIADAGAYDASMSFPFAHGERRTA